MEKILTVVICCYNSTKTILNTLDSLNVNWNKDVDVFLINDGSKDNLKGCVKEYLTKYPDRVHYFEKENGNWGSCINFAISKANSRFMSVLDSDDEYNKKSFQSVLQILRKAKPDTDMVFTNYEFHFLNERSTKINPVRISMTKELIKYKPYTKIGLKHFITIHSVIFATKILKDTNPLPSRVYYSDSLLIYQALLRAKNVAYLNKNIHLYKYFIRSGHQSISIEKSIKNFHHFEIVYECLLKQPFVKDTRKRLKISKRCLTMQIYWLMRVLANDFSKKTYERCEMLRQYIYQYEECVAQNNCSLFAFHTPLTLILKHIPRFALWITRIILGIVKTGFIKATDYSAQGKKEAKEFAKAQRKAWRKERRERMLKRFKRHHE